MPEPTKIPRPFADSGDKNTIPESSGALGFASWQEGFPAITGIPFAKGGVAPKRADFNGIFNALSAATIWQQQGGFYAYDATTDYEVGNIVEYSGDLYKCFSANGPSSAVKAPTDTTVWSKVMTSADVAALYLPLSTISTGTWTPELVGLSTPGTYTYKTQTGEYLKIGNLVYITGEIEIGDYTVHPVGRAYITGLPYRVNGQMTLLNLRGSSGLSNCFFKCTRATTTNGYTAIFIQGINQSTNVIDDMTFSATSQVNAGYLSLAAPSGGSTTGHLRFSGIYRMY